MKHLQLTDELLENASLYAAGAMTEDERRKYAGHLEEGCELCNAEVLELQAAMHAFAIDLPERSPSPGVKLRLMAQAELSASMRGIHSLPRSRGYEWLAWLVSAAATAALVVVLYLNSGLRNQVGSLNSQIADVTSPGTRVIDLAGQGATPHAGARVFWREDQHQWMVRVKDLPPVSKDRSYQLWFVPKKGAPVSAGVFNTNPDGTATLEIAAPSGIGELKATAVTTEPAGGLPQPTGAFVCSALYNVPLFTHKIRGVVGIASALV